MIVSLKVCNFAEKFGYGFQKGDLVIIGARPAVGKTAFALNIASNVALRNPEPVAFFSLEMPAEHVAMRILADKAKVEIQKIRTGTLTDEEWSRLNEASQELKRQNFFIDDTPGIRVADMYAKARKLARDNGLYMIIVDYIQLIQATGKSESRQQEVSEISRRLKAMARELNVPVIALSQLSRSVEQRQDKRPMLSDLRESGSIEQDADIVLMLQETKLNEAENNPKNQLDKHNQEVEKAKEQAAKASGDCKLATLFVRKNRSGKQGQVHLLFKKDCCRFDSLSEEANRQVEDLDKERIGYLPTGD